MPARDGENAAAIPVLTAAGRAGILPLVSAKLPAWISWIGRVGQAAKGLVYLAVALLASQVWWSGRGETGGSRAALRLLAQQPFGQLLLGAIIAGLSCYVCWRVLEAVADVAGRGRDWKGLALRARSFAVALVYSSIIFGAVKMLLGHGTRSDGDGPTQDWTARALQTPFGGALVIAIGLAVILGGSYKAWRAFSGKFEKKLQLAELTATARKWILRICIFGLSARGVVFILIGTFLIQAGLQSNPAKARGLSGSLDALRAQPLGSWLFAIVVAGLAAYGVYGCVRARYGRWDERLR